MVKQHGIILVAFALVLLCASREAVASRFTPGQPVSVWINWESFKARGFPDSKQAAVTDAVIGAYTRWQMVSGSDLKFVFKGYTTRPTGYNPALHNVNDFFKDNEILVFMGDDHDGRLGSFYDCAMGSGGPSRCGQIVLHSRPSLTGTPYSWVFWGSSLPNTYDVQSVLMHEFGHAHDLADDYTSATSVMSSYNFWNGRFGPSRSDRDKVVANYSINNRNQMRMFQSLDPVAATYSLIGSLPSSLHTTMDPSAVRSGTKLAFFYTSTTKNPCFITGTTSGTWYTNKWYCWGGSASQYGIGSDGDNDEYMWAFVKQLPGSDPEISVVHSTHTDLEAGTGSLRGLPMSRTYGTPGIAQVTDNTWILAYTRFSRGNAYNSGEVVARVTTNDGLTWGPEVVVMPTSTTYRAASGVTVAANRTNGTIRIGFSWTAYPSGAAQNVVRIIRATVAGSSIAYNGMMTGTEITRTQPVLRKAYSYFHMHYRDVSSNTFVANRVSTSTGTVWTGGSTLMDSHTETTPALAADPNSAFTYLFQVKRY